MPTDDVMLTHEQCDKIAAAVRKQQVAETGSGDVRRRKFTHALIRAGAAAQRSMDGGLTDVANASPPQVASRPTDATQTTLCGPSTHSIEGLPACVQGACAESVAVRLPDKGRAAANGAATTSKPAGANPIPSPAQPAASAQGRETDDDRCHICGAPAPCRCNEMEGLG